MTDAVEERPVEVITPTTAAEFKKGVIKMVTLPDGKIVRIRKLNLLSLLRHGVLPAWDEEQLAEAKRTKRTMDIVRSFHNPQTYHTFITAVLVEGCVEPKVTGKPEAEAAEDEVSIDSLDNATALALMNAISEHSGFAKDLSEFGTPFLGPRGGSSPGSSTGSASGMDAGPTRS